MGRHIAGSLVAGSGIVALWAPFDLAIAQSRVADDSQLTTVVVTAEKRPEPILSVAASITALTAGQLQTTEAVNLEDYAALVPGLNLISQREGQTQLVLRGITTGSSTPNATVAIYEDDTPYGSSTTFAGGNQLTLDLDPADIQRIEVLRGPQGTLYGASSIGGVLKYVTTPPDLESYRGRLEVDGDTLDGGGSGYGLRGMVNIPLAKDTLGLRVSGFDRLDPGYMDNQQLDRRNVNATRVYGGRAALLWRPADRLSVRVTTQYQSLHSGGMSEEDVDATTLRPLYGDLVQKRYSSEPLDIRYLLSSAVITYDLGWATILSATSVSSLNETQFNDLTPTYGPVLGPLLGVPDLGIAFDIPIDQHKVTQELRLTSPSNQTLEWQAGFFYTHERSSHGEQFDPFLTANGAAIPVNLLSGSLNDLYTEYAGYGDIDYHFTPAFDLMAGVRYGTNRQNYNQPGSGALVGPASTVLATSSDDSTTFLFSPRYHINEDNIVYARIASGYRPGGPNALTAAEAAGGVPASFRPDTLINYEAGYKANLLQHSLTLDLSVFYINWRDVQIQTLFNGFDASGNGGTARSDGIELSAIYAPVTGLTLSADLDYTEAELTADAPGINAKSGDELPNVPKLAVSLGADYSFPLFASWQGFVGGDLHYEGDRVSGFVTGVPAGFERPVMPSYETFNLRTGLKDDAWTVELYAKNIGNSRGITSLRSLAFNGFSNPYAAAIIQPRLIGISVATQF
jgi:outer membrane receptor protein involved in Fe transport